MDEVRILEQKESEEQPPSKTTKWLTCLIEMVILILGLLLVVILRVAVYEPVEVISGSMMDTVKVGDRILVDHRNTLHGHWKRGDIILFETSGDNWGDDTLMKRIIGLPGETVQVWRGRVYINGEQLMENYLRETPKPDDSVKVQLDDDQYFVMGDNRNNSDDSRVHGPITDREIRGRAVLKLYPFGRFKKPNYG